MQHTKATIVKNRANERDDMIRIVDSDEAKKIYHQTIKNIDSKALTKEGVIQSYKIDYKSIYHNPMGGVGFILIVNDDKDLTVNMLLDKYHGNLENQSGGSSAELLEQLRKKGLEQ